MNLRWLHWASTRQAPTRGHHLHHINNIYIYMIVDLEDRKAKPGNQTWSQDAALQPNVIAGRSHATPRIKY